MVGACVLGYRKARRGEGKRLGSGEAGFDAGEGRGNRVGRGILQATGDLGDSGNGPWMTLMALMDGNMVYLRQWCVSLSHEYIRCGN